MNYSLALIILFIVLVLVNSVLILLNIIKLFKGKTNRRLNIALLITVSLSILTFIFLSIRGFQYVSREVNHYKSKTLNISIDFLWSFLDDSRTNLLNEKPINPEIKKLISYEPKEYNGNIPSDFYTYFGYYDWYRMPLVYPYSLNCVDQLEYGHIFDERNAINIKGSHLGVNQLDIYNIKKFTFDSTLFLGILTPNYNDSIGVEYATFNFKTGEIQKFKTNSELLKFAKNKNFSGSLDFITVQEYYNRF